MKIKNNILIITSVTEERSGIDAIRAQFEKYHQNYNVIVIDENQYGAVKFATQRGKTRERFIQSNPIFYRKFRSAKLLFTKRTSDYMDARRAVSSKLKGTTRKIYNAILRFSPDVILVTTPRIMHEAVSAKKRTRFKNPIIGISERFTFDKAFYNMSADGYIVENVDMKNQLTAMGYSSNRVFVLGFPIEENMPDVDYLVKKKEHLGLNMNPTVYLSGSTIGSKELYPVYELLLDQGTMINIIVNCGRNEGLYAMMLKEAEKRGANNVKVYLNSDEESEDTLCASDCLITIFDAALIYRAFLLGIPVIAYAPDNGSERADLMYLKEKGLIFFAPDYNRVIIGMYEIIQTELSKKLVDAAKLRTRANSLEDICGMLSTYAMRAKNND